MSIGKSVIMSDTESNTPFENVTSSETGSAYRVRVSLKKYFTDERCRVYVLVSSRRRVSWLEQRLRQLFGLRGPFRLTSRGNLLPSAEHLAILRPDELVDVIPISNEKDNIQIVKVSTGQEKTKSYQTEKNENMANGSHPSSNSEVDVTENEESDTSGLENYKKQALELLEQKYSEINRDGTPNENNLSYVADDAFGLDLPTRKRRRVRHRKRPSKCANGREGIEEAGSEAGARAPAEGEAPVLRNRAASPRAPRRVHAAL